LQQEYKDFSQIQGGKKVAKRGRTKGKQQMSWAQHTSSEDHRTGPGFGPALLVDFMA